MLFDVVDEVYEIDQYDFPDLQKVNAHWRPLGSRSKIRPTMLAADVLDSNDIELLNDLQATQDGDEHTIVICYSNTEAKCGYPELKDSFSLAKCNRGCVITLFPILFDEKVQLCQSDEKTAELGVGKRSIQTYRQNISAVLIHELAHLAVYGGKSVKYGVLSFVTVKR
jgi:hypothetical protein